MIWVCGELITINWWKYWICIAVNLTHSLSKILTGTEQRVLCVSVSIATLVKQSYRVVGSRRLPHIASSELTSTSSLLTSSPTVNQPSAVTKERIDVLSQPKHRTKATNHSKKRKRRRSGNNRARSGTRGTDTKPVQLSKHPGQGSCPPDRVGCCGRDLGSLGREEVKPGAWGVRPGF